MKIEAYGGSCPTCQKSMLQRWESRNEGILFDACPWCGFAHGEKGTGAALSADHIWKVILRTYDVTSRFELQLRLKLKQNIPSSANAFYPSVFSYAPALAS